MITENETPIALVVETQEHRIETLTASLIGKGYRVYGIAYSRGTQDALHANGVNAIFLDEISQMTIITALGHVIKKEGHIDLFITCHSEPEALMITDRREYQETAFPEMNTIVQMLLHAMSNRDTGIIANLQFKGDEYRLDFFDSATGNPGHTAGCLRDSIDPLHLLSEIPSLAFIA